MLVCDEEIEHFCLRKKKRFDESKLKREEDNEKRKEGVERGRKELLRGQSLSMPSCSLPVSQAFSILFCISSTTEREVMYG